MPCQTAQVSALGGRRLDPNIERSRTDEHGVTTREVGICPGAFKIKESLSCQIMERALKPRPGQKLNSICAFRSTETSQVRAWGSQRPTLFFKENTSWKLGFSTADQGGRKQTAELGVGWGVANSGNEEQIHRADIWPWGENQYE